MLRERKQLKLGKVEEESEVQNFNMALWAFFNDYYLVLLLM